MALSPVFGASRGETLLMVRIVYLYLAGIGMSLPIPND